MQSRLNLLDSIGLDDKLQCVSPLPPPGVCGTYYTSAQLAIHKELLIDDASMVAHQSTYLIYFSPIRRYVDLRPVL
jgi:hypothetical protein